MSLSVERNERRAQIDAALIALAIRASLGLGILMSGFVLFEPAPYELYMAGLVAVFFLFGLRISRQILPLLLLLVLFVIGGVIAALQMDRPHDASLYLAVTFFLGMTAIFLAALTGSRPALLGTIFNALLIAGVATSLAGMAGYFQLLPGAEIFTRYGRASGAFEDPNVFGPFLVLPAIWLMHRMLLGNAREWLRCALPLILLLGGIFLSFSRGAWGLFLLCAVLLILADMLQSQSTLVRARIVVLALSVLAIVAAGIIIALQVPGIAEVFAERARLMQEYDAARFGRFARMLSGLALAIEHPLGIGALEFGRMFGEDTHNIWLKALLDYSWAGFAAFFTLIVWTLAAGLRILFRNRPWQPYLLTAYIVFAGHIVLGSVIDLDHWRHFYLLLGLIWGCLLMEGRWKMTQGGMAPIKDVVEQ